MTPTAPTVRARLPDEGRRHRNPASRWPRLKAYVERLSLEQPFRVDLDYYEGRAHGIASVNGVSIAEARRDLAARHGFGSWRELRRHVEAMHGGQEPPTPFVLAYQAVEANDDERLAELLDRFPDLIAQRGTNGNDLLGMAEDLATVALLLERGADPNRGGFPAWQPSDDPQEVFDEALVWAAKSDRVEAIRLLVELGARVDADPYRGTPLTWAAVNGRVESVRTLVELGADPNLRGTFGGPSHGEGVTAIHLASQAGRREAVLTLLELGADPLILDSLHGGNALGWARVGGHEKLADVLP